MTFFVAFVFAALILGVGAMLAPALPTEQARIGLASTLALAIVITGGILWTRFIGWDTLVIDYLLFGLVSLVVLGGTMVQAHQKATSDSDDKQFDSQTTTHTDFLFFGIMAIICLIPLFLPIQSQITDINFTYGQSLSEINNTYPQLDSFGATGFYTLTVYLAQQLRQDMATVQLAVTSVLAFLCVWTAYDLGAEMKNIFWGRVFAIVILIILAIGYFLLPNLPISLMGLLFIIACLIFGFRSVKYCQWQDILGTILLFASFIIG